MSDFIWNRSINKSFFGISKYLNKSLSLNNSFSQHKSSWPQQSGTQAVSLSVNETNILWSLWPTTRLGNCSKMVKWPAMAQYSPAVLLSNFQCPHPGDLSSAEHTLSDFASQSFSQKGRLVACHINLMLLQVRLLGFRRHLFQERRHSTMLNEDSQSFFL